MPDPTERKPLLRIRDLRHYFAVNPRKNLFLKANDGISLDIYEGETFGLVGESGCGKSTFGRVLLQLHRQTQGRSLYYGRALDELAPDYVRATAACLRSGRRRARRMETAYPDVAEVMGGLLSADDPAEAASAVLALHRAALARRKARAVRDRLQVRLDDVAFALSQPGGQRKKARQEALLARMRTLEAHIGTLDAEVAARHAALEALREKCRNHPNFERHEAAREEGVNLARLKPGEMRRLRRDLQLIFQDPYSSLNPRMTVGQIIGEGLRTHGFFRANNERRQDYILNVLDQCGLAPYTLHRYPHQFSGGQRQRVGIARSLAVKPKFVVCDEAVSALDVSIRSQILNLLQDLRQRENLTYLFISHDLSVVKYICDRVGVMYLGHLVEIADSALLFAHPAHPYTVALLEAIPGINPDRAKPVHILEGDIPSPVHPPAGCTFHPRCVYASARCKEAVPAFQEVEPGHFVACHFDF